MDKETFKNKIECEFAVITNEIDPQVVTSALGIMPDRTFKKGDLVTSKHSSSIGKRPYGLWALSSKEILDVDIDLSKHLKFFHAILNEHIDKIISLRLQNGFESTFSISIETEDAGYGIDIGEFYLSFINKISVRFSVFFISKENIVFEH